MIREKKDFEKKILELFKKLLEEKNSKFAKKNITYKSPELHFLKEKDDDYTSEVRTYFYQNKKLIDAIEFFVFFDGKPQATKAEFEIWIIEELNNISLGWHENT
ncbi:MAG: hypothetical protein KR126chlam5_00931 [Candidatus Anoxychlamydiales bacterium]|nr:hypothetical protein [Candidatus Anoxychlamydiales bacterium]